MPTLRKATTPEDIATVRTMFEEYQRVIASEGGKSAQDHICFQGFAAELAALETMYGAPDGALWLVDDDEGAVACVGMRRLAGSDKAEMKRLYVRTRGRGSGWGRRLTEEVLREAKRCGYEAVVLDTLASMQPALQLYAKLGFQPRGPFYDGAPVEAIYLELPLQH